jgi:hypothetical protein
MDATNHTYLIGSLRNQRIPALAEEMRAAGISVFDDWHCAGADADTCWQEYEQARGRSYAEALNGAHARNVFEFDKRNIDAASAVVLVLPAGKSAHLELGYARGSGKPCYILLDGEPDRYDVMYRFADAVFGSVGELIDELTDAPAPNANLRRYAQLRHIGTDGSRDYYTPDGYSPRDMGPR